jgi:hypothetical protein
MEVKEGGTTSDKVKIPYAGGPKGGSGAWVAVFYSCHTGSAQWSPFA